MLFSHPLSATGLYVTHAHPSKDATVISYDGEADGGKLEVVTRMSTDRHAGFPQMVWAGQELIFAWTETTGETPRVRTTVLDAPTPQVTALNKED